MRPREPMYPVVFFDALPVNICEEAVVRNNAIYPVLGVLPDGSRDIPGLWIWIRPESGPENLCIGTKSSIGTVESATSARTNGMPVKIRMFFLHAIACTSPRKRPIQGAGLAKPETGRRLVQSLSTMKNRNSPKPHHPVKINRQ